MSWNSRKKSWGETHEKKLISWNSGKNSKNSWVLSLNYMFVSSWDLVKSKSSDLQKFHLSQFKWKIIIKVLISLYKRKADQFVMQFIVTVKCTMASTDPYPSNRTIHEAHDIFWSGWRNLKSMSIITNAKMALSIMLFPLLGLGLNIWFS